MTERVKEMQTLTLRVSIPEGALRHKMFSEAIHEFLAFADRREDGECYSDRGLTSMPRRGVIDAAPVRIEWEVSE